ncbi:hypothetical protein D9M71_428690 [compost metagenome]
MQFLADCLQVLEMVVAGSPQAHRLPDVSDVAEVAVQPDHAAHILGMIAALQRTLPGQIEVRLQAVQFGAHEAVAQRNTDGFAITPVIRRIARLTIALQVIDGVLLPLGPEAFAADIGTHRG